eukprot:TRINITY_DN39781_c0_g1_i2.p1 TRINITY_DN39781_c0_g1~~TRINITY_DN39781_c0_g1_i2.p1  ORF type:complete len:174 (-),score=17.17 TRINITY_DN39781_c0_g1_i2:75-566(-)
MIRTIVDAFVRGSSTPSRSRRGLYGGRKIGTGKQVSYSNKKTKRRWLPNVQKKSLYSELLGKYFRVRLTTYALRDIDKSGGIDNYILYMPVKKRKESDLAEEIYTILTRKWKKVHGEPFNQKKEIEKYRKDLLYYSNLIYDRENGIDDKLNNNVNNTISTNEQ